MTGFPSPFTADSDFQVYAKEQNLANFLESGASFTSLHTGARDAVMRWLKAHGTDPDLIDNATDYKAAAVYWVLSLIFEAEKDSDKAFGYSKRFEREMVGNTSPEITTDDDHEGGQVGRVVTECRNGIDARGTGARQHYRPRRAGRRFGR